MPCRDTQLRTGAALSVPEKATETSEAIPASPDSTSLRQPASSVETGVRELWETDRKDTVRMVRITSMPEPHSMVL